MKDCLPPRAPARTKQRHSRPTDDIFIARDCAACSALGAARVYVQKGGVDVQREKMGSKDCAAPHAAPPQLMCGECMAEHRPLPGWRQAAVPQALNATETRGTR